MATNYQQGEAFAAYQGELNPTGRWWETSIFHRHQVLTTSVAGLIVVALLGLLMASTERGNRVAQALFVPPAEENDNSNQSDEEEESDGEGPGDDGASADGDTDKGAGGAAAGTDDSEETDEGNDGEDSGNNNAKEPEPKPSAQSRERRMAQVRAARARMTPPIKGFDRSLAFFNDEFPAEAPLRGFWKLLDSGYNHEPRLAVIQWMPTDELEELRSSNRIRMERKYPAQVVVRETRVNTELDQPFDVIKPRQIRDTVTGLNAASVVVEHKPGFDPRSLTFIMERMKKEDPGSGPPRGPTASDGWTARR